ncbi:ankyrin repeat domain protein [Nitzschia inconspicua]|uniref:Ankyrin repeat domain protein n=1 Tax=Nitzschia inconspicua TaxID=303405 RepID=A0A9K3KR48_9STRA|nr:ankyrin repeat domain protein [Nitzschia inconspicua]
MISQYRLSWTFVNLIATLLMISPMALAIPNAVFEGVQLDDGDKIRTALEADPSLLESIGVGGQTPLIHAVLTGKMNAVKTLLDVGADTSATERDGYNVMHAAGFQGRAEILQVLLDRGLDPMDKHKDGFYPLHRACWGPQERHTETVKVFLDHGVSGNLASADGKTCAEMTRNEKTLALLTDKERSSEEEL